jgi:hypothetical protein
MINAMRHKAYYDFNKKNKWTNTINRLCF